MTATTIQLPKLHDPQWQIAQSAARFIVLVTGRRFGKTLLGTALCTKAGLERRRAWWVAPSYKMAAVGWRGLKKLARQIPGVEIRESERLIVYPGGGWAQVRSGDDPDSLRGEGLDLVVMDECAFMKPEVWTDALRPALSDRKGRALFISTPNGRNWLWELYQRGIDPTQPDWAAFHFQTADNPYIDPAEIEAAREGLPGRVFDQEYLAVFLEDGGTVFRNITQAVTAPKPAEKHQGHDIVIGADWGKLNDYTVFTAVCRQCRCMVDWDRMNQVDYVLQVGRLQNMVQKWGPRVTVYPEQNSMGVPIIEQLERVGLRVREFQTTASSKPPLIESLALAIERGEIALQDEPVMIGELQAYTMKLNPNTGRPTYSAPEGMHDDCVMSLALAWYGCTASPTMTSVPQTGLYLSQRNTRKEGPLS